MTTLAARKCKWCESRMEVRPGGALLCGHCDGACPGPRFCARCKRMFPTSPFKV